MKAYLLSTVLIAVGVITASSAVTTAFAKQLCSASNPSNPHEYWSWRIIDGRKCWYKGRPMLAKSELEWAAPSLPAATSASEPVSAPARFPSDPLDAQAKSIDPESFEALWQARIGNR